MPRPLIELVVALVVAALCIAGFFEAANYRGASAYLPNAVLALALLLSLIWALQSVIALRKGDWDTDAPGVESWPKLLSFFAVVFVYVIIIPLLGFFTTTLVFIPLVTVMLGYRKKSVLVGAPIVFVAALYVLFGLVLRVQLPDELLLQLAGTNG